ncbi:type II secretion system protein [Candidatus Saccharibacteria bacterium TM7i]|nr:type II secretion system protein [Candidatus Saccharibacteria bacterium TM7i]
MKRAWSSQRGFTIIETVLFLGVTGLMIAAMFIGIGSSIGTQRYKDSVESFKATLQQQYSDVVNVYNGSESKRTCVIGSGGNLVVQQSQSGLSRGQARCEILGRYVTVSTSGAIRTQTVLGIKSGVTGASGSDIDKLKAAYSFGVSGTEVETSQMEWGTRLGWPQKSPVERQGSGDRSLALLVLRSPETGGIYTFTGNDVYDTPTNARIKELLVASTVAASNATNFGRAQRLLCIDSDGLVLTATRGVYIDAAAADSSAVRVALPTDFTGDESC